MTKSIGGTLNYDLLAQQHRPKDPAALQREVRRLASSQGLSVLDISAALRLDLVQVRQMLALTGDEAAAAHSQVWK